VDRSYRLGLGIVTGTVALAAFLCILRVDAKGARPATDANAMLRQQPLPLGSFRLTDQNGRQVTEKTLDDRVWITSFIFTRCPISCPRISAVMKGLQGKLDKTGVKLVSVSVDPEYDTPTVLARYAKALGADPNRWLFLTGAKDDVYSLILDGFKVPVSDAPEPGDDHEQAEAVSHSNRLVLVAPGGQIMGYYEAEDAGSLTRLLADAKRLDPRSKSILPTVNASLNGTCSVLLVLAWGAIRRRRVKLHMGLMIAALVVAMMFLTSYLTYHFQVGSVPFRGTGAVRVLYFTILLSHTVLAAAVVPLILLTVRRAYRREFHRHAALAKVTFPIWLYVSMTGVAVYLMLYQFDFA
jgi:protein SCO1/2/putative membrane protein